MEQVSYSEVTSYRRCQKAWEYRYLQRIKRRYKGVRLLIGSILHDMLNAHIAPKLEKGWEGGDPWDVLDEYAKEYATYFEEEREEYGDIIGNCGKIFEGYLRKHRRDPLEYEESEIKVELDLSKLSAGALPVKFVGVIDKIARDEQKRRWIMDHKFMKSIPTADDRFSELQLLLYVWAWGMMHPKDKLDGVCWDYARSKAPTVPEVLKNGKSLTIRKNLDCDVYTYRRAIKRAGFQLDDYTEMLEHLAGKEDSFFERVFLPKPSTVMVGEVVNDFLQTTSEILVKRAANDPTRSRNARSMSPFNCNNCEYRTVCEAEVRGMDADFIKKSEYVERTKHEEAA